MWKKKQEGGFKPLWVKCPCGKWNSVPVGNVVKYLDKLVSPATKVPDTPLPEKSAKNHE